MKIEKEVVTPDPGQSFKIFTPSLRNYFFWHYHPEVELVYVEAATGIRHVGRHISSYIESDLLLIGPNVPHLNFDYGIKNKYKQIVVQLMENFLGDGLQKAPELVMVKNLFHKASYGLSFHGETKEVVAKILKEMVILGPFERLLHLMEAFQILALSSEVTELNDKDTSVKLFLNDKIRMGAVYQYIHENYNKKPDVNQVAANVHLSTPAFCRYFKKQTNMTFTDFVNRYRVAQAKTLFLQNKTASEACFETGIESLSYFNKIFKKFAGENPTEFKKRYLR
jgi:AraC-like DNA-binding protein